MSTYRVALMLRRIFVVGLMVGWWAVIGVGSTSAQLLVRSSSNPPTPVSPVLSPDGLKIFQALHNDKTLVDMELVETPLDDVIVLLRAKYSLPIQWDTQALQESTTSPDLPVTKNIKGVTLDSALRLLFRYCDLTYTIRDDVLLITTNPKAEDIAQYGVVMIYPVEDLLATADLPLAKRQSDEADFAPLIKMLTSAVDPESWTKKGGATIQAIPAQGTLVVLQSMSGHRAIAANLQAMRNTRSQMPPLAGAPTDTQSLPFRIYELDWRFIHEKRTEEVMLEILSGHPMPPSELGISKPETTIWASPDHGNLTAEELAKLMLRTIEPKSWSDAGGRGTIDIMGGKLAIRQIPQVHQKIEKLLQAVYH